MTGREQTRGPSLRVEQIAAGERVGAVDAGELAALRGSDAEILAAYPPAAVAAEVRRRAASRGGSPARRAIWLGLPAVAAAGLLVVLRPWAPETRDVSEPPVLGDMGDSGGDTRIKGLVPHLVLHRQVGADTEQLRAPARAGAGDVLQVSYVAAGASHGVIVSLDGAGVVTLHHPRTDPGATGLQQGGAVRLGQAYELDAAPGFERFVFVTAAGPIDAAQVVAAAQALAGRPEAARAPLRLPAAWQQSSFFVEKVSP